MNHSLKIFLALCALSVSAQAVDLPLGLRGFFDNGSEILCSVYDQKHDRSYWVKEGQQIPNWEGVVLSSIHIKERFVEFESRRHGDQRVALNGAAFKVNLITRTPKDLGLENMVRIYQAHERKRKQRSE